MYLCCRRAAAGINFLSAGLSRGRGQRFWHVSSVSMQLPTPSSLVTAVVDDVQSGLARKNHVFLATGQYSDRKENERVVVSSMKSSPATTLQSAGDLNVLKPLVLFDGYLAPEEIDELQDRLSRLNCSLYVGEVDALRASPALAGFTHTPAVSVVPLGCATTAPREHDMWTWITLTRNSVLFCEMPSPSVAATQSSASDDEDLSTIPSAAYIRTATRSVPFSDIACVQVHLESTEWEFAELQIQLNSGEVITLLKTDLNGVMEELIDTDSYVEENNDSSYGETNDVQNGKDVSWSGDNLAAAKSEEDATLHRFESIFDTDLDDDKLESVDFANGRVKPELAIVMSTEWMVKLAARLCLTCHQQGYPVMMRLPSVLRAECNKWVEYRNDVWMSSRRAPVT